MKLPKHAKWINATIMFDRIWGVLMSFIVCCKKNIKTVYTVLIPFMFVVTCACIGLAIKYLISFNSSTQDELVMIPILLIVVALTIWGIYSFINSISLKLTVDNDDIEISSLLRGQKHINVTQIEKVDFRRHHDSSRYAPKDRYIMLLYIEGKSVKLIEDEMENFNKLCKFLHQKNVPTTDETTKINLKGRAYTIAE